MPETVFGNQLVPHSRFDRAGSHTAAPGRPAWHQNVTPDDTRTERVLNERKQISHGEEGIGEKRKRSVKN